MTTTTFTAEQIATDFNFADCQDRVVLPDGTLAFVGEDHETGRPAAFRSRACTDYGGNVLAVRRADESCCGIAAGRTPTVIGHDDRVAGVRLTYIGPARDCTGRQIYRVEAV